MKRRELLQPVRKSKFHGEGATGRTLARWRVLRGGRRRRRRGGRRRGGRRRGGVQGGRTEKVLLNRASLDAEELYLEARRLRLGLGVVGVVREVRVERGEREDRLRHGERRDVVDFIRLRVHVRDVERRPAALVGGGVRRGGRRRDQDERAAAGRGDAARAGGSCVRGRPGERQGVVAARGVARRHRPQANRLAAVDGRREAVAGEERNGVHGGAAGGREVRHELQAVVEDANAAVGRRRRERRAVGAPADVVATRAAPRELLQRGRVARVGDDDRPRLARDREGGGGRGAGAPREADRARDF